MKKDVLVITDNKDKLLERISEQSTKINALEYMEQKWGWIEKLKQSVPERTPMREKSHDRSPELEL